MKNKNIALWICIVITFIIATMSVILNFIPCDKNKNATEIFKTCLYNVVEIKASSEGVGESFGTGEIISADGKIITNSHVITYKRLNTVNEFENYFIRFSFEDDYRSAVLEKYDSNLDIAVLKITDFSDLITKPITFGNSDELEAGERVYAVGNASNYGVGIYEGIISIPLLSVELDGLTRRVIQCDLTIASGNSGGALLNDRGELIGLTTFRTRDNSGNVIYGIVYSIPINTVLEYINK